MNEEEKKRILEILETTPKDKQIEAIENFLGKERFSDFIKNTYRKNIYGGLFDPSFSITISFLDIFE